MSKDPYTAAFQTAALTLRLPRLPLERARRPAHDADFSNKLAWAEGLMGDERTEAYYDEKLLCVCELAFRAPLAGKPSFTFTDFQTLCDSSQITADCSFLTPNQASHAESSASYPSRRPPSGPSRNASSARLFRSKPSGSVVPTLSVTTAGHAQQVLNSANALPPNTPNPMPSTRDGDENYALSEGRIVWEGALRGLPGDDEEEDAGPTLLEIPAQAQAEGRADDPVWKAIWTGYLPLSFADLAPADDPTSMLGVTATITLRSEDLAARRAEGRYEGRRPSAMHLRESTTSDEEDQEPPLQVKVSAGSLRTMDLLQGLGGTDPLPSSRFTHVQDVMHPLIGDSTKTSSSSSARSSLIAKHSGARGLVLGGTTSSLEEKTEMAAVMRKSFRSVLPLLSALQIRMRTLPSIMVDTTLAERDREADEVNESLDPDNGGDRGQTLICVEAELGTGMSTLDAEYELEDLEVIVAGRRRAGLLWADDAAGGTSGQFPLTIGKGEQHNFVFKIDPPSASSWATGHEPGQEHIRIAIKGAVVDQVISRPAPGDEPFKTDRFSAIWNSVVDMRALAIPPKTATFGFTEPASDRYGGKGPHGAAIMTAGMRSVHAGGPIPSTAGTEQTKGLAGGRGPFGMGVDQVDMGDLQRDLIMSATIVPLSSEEGDLAPAEDVSVAKGRRATNDVRTFQPFMLEIIFLNLAEEVLKLMVSVCLDQTSSTGQAQLVIPLEQSTTLTPLQPRACQAVRLRCMPIGIGILDVPPIEIHDLGRGMSCRAVLGMKVRAS